eukprot:2806583-Pyramimonas_sp.AAC.1
MFKARSHLHVFTSEGIDTDELRSSAENMADVAAEYDNLALHPDKILGFTDSPHEQAEVEQELLHFLKLDGSDKEVMRLGNPRVAY